LGRCPGFCQPEPCLHLEGCANVVTCRDGRSPIAQPQESQGAGGAADKRRLLLLVFVHLLLLLLLLTFFFFAVATARRACHAAQAGVSASMNQLVATKGRGMIAYLVSVPVHPLRFPCVLMLRKRTKGEKRGDASSLAVRLRGSESGLGEPDEGDRGCNLELTP